MRRLRRRSSVHGLAECNVTFHERDAALWSTESRVPQNATPDSPIPSADSRDASSRTRERRRFIHGREAAFSEQAVALTIRDLASAECNVSFEER